MTPIRIKYRKICPYFSCHDTAFDWSRKKANLKILVCTSSQEGKKKKIKFFFFFPIADIRSLGFNSYWKAVRTCVRIRKGFRSLFLSRARHNLLLRCSSLDRLFFLVSFLEKKENKKTRLLALRLGKEFQRGQRKREPQKKKEKNFFLNFWALIFPNKKREKKKRRKKRNE